VATVHVTSNASSNAGSQSSGWSRPTGVTRVQMMTLSLVGSPDATPCANAPWISACARGKSSDATRSGSAAARAKRADRLADGISRSVSRAAED
jgi:hypothetical protein